MCKSAFSPTQLVGEPLVVGEGGHYPLPRLSVLDAVVQLFLYILHIMSGRHILMYKKMALKKTGQFVHVMVS